MSSRVFALLTLYTHYQGQVTIAAKPGSKLEIPDGVVIENKVQYKFKYELLNFFIATLFLSMIL